jgi:hypothetical protein
MRRMAGPPNPPPRRRRRGLPGWIPIALILLLIFGGIGLIGVGLVSDAGEEPTATEQAGDSAQAPPASDQPAQAKKPAAADKPATTDKPAAVDRPVEPTPQASPAGIDRRTFAGRFELGVPSGWHSGQRNGATMLTAPGGAAQVEVLFGSQRPFGQLDGVATQLLRQRHSGGRVGKAKRVRIGGQPAIRVDARFADGSASALALNAGGVSYVLLERIDRGAPGAVRSQAEAVIQSFRAL